MPYDHGFWNETMVWNATRNPKSNPWITEDEAKEILGLVEETE